MATTSSKSGKNFFEVDDSSMKTNSVDQVSSLLMSLLVMVGLAVLMLGLLFFLRMAGTRVEKLILEPEKIAGRGDNAEGFERDFDPPGADEVEQLNEPAMEQTLQLVSEAISNISAALESMDSNMATNNNGTGKGDSRPPGEEGEGDDIVPRFERWDIKFQARDKKGYGLQLDFYKIELGAYGGTIPMVDYVSNVSSQPARRSGPPKADKRLYFLSVTEGVLKQYDKQYLQSAGVNLAGRAPIKFIPKETEELLAQAEAKYYIAKRSPNLRVAEIAKTVFESRPNPSGRGFEFVVVDQRYRGVKKK